MFLFSSVSQNLLSFHYAPPTASSTKCNQLWQIQFPFRKSILNYLNVAYIKTVHKSYISFIIRSIQHVRTPFMQFQKHKEWQQADTENGLSRQCTLSFVPSALTPFTLDTGKGQSLTLQEQQLLRCTQDASYKLQQCFAVLVQNILL